MDLTPEQRVEQIIAEIGKAQGISREDARTQLHKFVCRGTCEWYKTKSNAAGFDRSSLAEEQRKSVAQIVAEVMEGSTQKDARAEIHAVLCPGAK